MFFFLFMSMGSSIPAKEDKEKRYKEALVASALTISQFLILWIMIFKEPFLEGQALLASYFIIAIGIGFFFGVLRLLVRLTIDWMFRGLKNAE